MNNQWLFISSYKARQTLLGDFLSYCKNNNKPFSLMTMSRRLWRRGRHEHWSMKKLRLITIRPFVFIILFPLIWLLAGMNFIFTIWQKRPSAVVLVNWPEQILFSGMASKRCKHLIWLDYPDQNIDHCPWFIRNLYYRAAKKATILSFNQVRVEELKKNGLEKTMLLNPAPSGQLIRQDSIFKTLANQGERGRFVIGSVLYGLPKDQAERLLSALAIAQSVCPIIELVIIGEGKNRRQIQWLAKRMNLEKKVWLVGPATDFGKWLTHFDAYIIATSKPGLEDLSWAINALAVGLPVLGPQKDWLSSVITNKTGILLDINDPELIAQQFIKLQQEDELRQALSKEARHHSQNFTFDRFAQTMVKLLS